MTPHDIIKRLSQIESARRVVEQQWDDIRELVVPYRGDFFLEGSGGEVQVDWRENRNVFDSTAIHGAQTLAASIHGSLTSPAIRWYEMRFRDDTLNDDVEASKWINDVADMTYQTLQDSNFNLEISELYLDLTSMGTSVVVEEVVDEDEWDGIHFQTIPVKECYFEEDHKGRVKVLYRKLMWTPVQIESKFGDDTPADIQAQIKAGIAINERIEIIFCIYPRPGQSKVDVSKTMDATLRPYGYKYVMRKNQKEIGKEGGYYEMPSFAPRWRKTSGSQWGNSPAMLALPDIKSLNVRVEQREIASEKVIDPATLITERNYFGQMDLSPGMQNVVHDIDGVKAYESGAKFDVSFESEDRLQRNINRAFHVDELQLKESPAMTATEVQVRYELMQRLLGPTLGRLQSDLLDPMVIRTVGILHRAGRLPDMPKIVQDLQGRLNIEYVGPLTRAQKSDKIMTIDRWVDGQIQQAEASEGESLDIVEWDQVGKQRGEAIGVPAKMMRSEADIAKKRKGRAERMEKQMDLEQQNIQADIMKKVGEGEQREVAA